MAPPVRRIVDASRLILLEKAGQLDLLRVGGPEVIVPEVVDDEVGALGATDPTFRAVQRCGWLTRSPRRPIPADVAAWNLGAGESAVLALAMSLTDREVVLDDRQARRCAQARGIPIRGTVGLILLARRLGQIRSARPVVERLRQVGLYLTDELVEQALASVGE